MAKAAPERANSPTDTARRLPLSPGQYWHHELCAEHDGSIADFTKITATIGELDEFASLMRPRKPNLYARAKRAGLVAGSIATLGAGAWLAAPRAATLAGSAGGLSSAALKSASFTRVGATGASLLSLGAVGQRTGYALANAYFKAIPDYEFRQKRASHSASRRRILVVNGFLTEDDHDTRDWLDGLAGYDDDSPVWHLNWEARTLRQLGRVLTGASREWVMRGAVKRGWLKGSAIPYGGAVHAGLTLVTNPWHTAMRNADKAGVLLAEAITRMEGKHFVLLGHSLGARVILSALHTLAEKGETDRVENAILLGGAVGSRNTAKWEKACSAVTGQVVNCYSHHDKILGYLYRSANFGLSRPAGYRATELDIDNLLELDCSARVRGHLDWKPQLPALLQQMNLPDMR